MSEKPSYLKGNFETKKLTEPKEASLGKEEQLEQEFYRRSFEKLGGSIAFIMKSKNLLWKGDQPQDGKGPARD